MSIHKIIKQIVFLAVLLSGAGLVSACANSWREVSSGRSADEVAAGLEEFRASPTITDRGTDPNPNYLNTVLGSQDKIIYYAENNAAMGPLHTVFPIDFAALTNGEVAYESLTSVKVYFVLQKQGSGYTGMLLVNYNTNNGAAAWVVYQNSGTNLPLGEIVDGEFSIQLQSEFFGKTITIYSDDINSAGDDLAQAIQLSIYDEEHFLGLVSSMEGF